ncbi:hypothetical protein HZF02_18845 [Pseudomonas yamanorum]|nr:hypothetical protein HZF02_18845 [Pseudomonas yamanorum]
MLTKKLKALSTLICVVMVADILVGCSVKPVTAQEAKPISPDRQYAYSGKDEASLVVTRDKGWYEGDGGIRVDFLIDGKLAAKVNTGEVVQFGLKAGSHIIAVTIGGTLVEREVNLKAGETIRRRITYYNDLDITPTAFK